MSVRASLIEMSFRKFIWINNHNLVKSPKCEVTNTDLQNYKYFWIFDKNRHTYLGNNYYELENVNGHMAWMIFIFQPTLKF